MKNEVKVEFKNFSISLCVMAGFFFLAYFSALSNGAPGIEQSELPVWQSILGVSVAVVFFATWITLIIHCFKTTYTSKKAAWGLSLIFLQWLAMIPYVFWVYIPSLRNHSNEQ